MDSFDEEEYGTGELVVTDDLQFAFESIIEAFSKYLSLYIHVLNRFINHLRRVGSLKYERTNLIKFVKKLRHFNDTLQMIQNNIYEDAHVSDPLEKSIVYMASNFVKLLEVIDLLNFIFTSSLQKEIISKTLNFDLTLCEECISSIEDTYKVFVKYTQWMVESIGVENPSIQLEVVSTALKYAAEDQENENYDGETDNIFVQEIMEVEDSIEYLKLTHDWDIILRSHIKRLETEFDDAANKWQEKFGKKK